MVVGAGFIPALTPLAVIIPPRAIRLNIPPADSADLADFLIRYYYVVHECTIDLRNQRNQRGKEIFSVDIPTHISQISQISIQMLLCSA